MVRPYYSSLREKQSFRRSQESHGGMHCADSHSPRPRTRRDLQGPPTKLHRWRESARGGAPHFSRRPDNQWGPRQRSPAHGYPAQTGLQNSHRRRSPPWSSPPPPQFCHRSPLTHGHCPPASRSPLPKVPFPGRFSPSSPRRFHNEPSHRRSPSPRHSPHWGLHRRHGTEPGSGWVPGPRWHHRPRGGHQCRGERWNGTRGFRFSPSPQRRSMEFHRRSPYQERLSTELEAKKHGRNEVERDGGGRSSAWGREHSPRYAHRSPKWRASPSASAAASSSSPRFHHRSEEKLVRPLKRRSQDEGLGFEQPSKRARREASQHPPSHRGFGGRALSLKDKSRLLKARMVRATSEVRLGVPQKISRETGNTEKLRHPKSWAPKDVEEKEQTSTEEGKVRQEAAKVQPLKKHTLKKVPCKSPFAAEGADDQKRDKETLTIKVDTRHTLSNYRQLSRDLVIVSQQGLASRSEASISDHWKNKSQEAQENSSAPQEPQKQSLTLNERFSKLQKEHPSARVGNGRYSGLKIQRKIHIPLLNHKTVKMSKAPPPSKPMSHHSDSEAKPSVPQRSELVQRLGTFKKPLMVSVVPRPSFHQKPAFRKSQSITTKYRQMQALRYRGPTYPHGHNPHHRGPAPYSHGPAPYKRGPPYISNSFHHR